MLDGHDVICLASQAWRSHWCTPQQIASRLARKARVLYVEPPRSPLWRVRRAATQSVERAGPPREVMPNVWVLTMPAVFAPMELYRRVPWLRDLNNRLMGRFVEAAARELGLHEPVAWNYLITYQGAPLLRRAALLVYDCIDEWAGGTDDASLKRYFSHLDTRLCREADVLFVGSQSLAASRRNVNACQLLVPQGVDLAHFLAPPAGTPLPADLAGLPRPVLGLVGVLNRERVDVPLLCRLAEQHCGGSVVLVGPVWDGLDVATLARRPNIHLLGNKPREQLGAYLAGFDVCLLPYLINDFTRNIFPLKLFEYLACGKPFVATAVPACSEFPRLIRTAQDHGGFLAAAEAALAEHDPALRAERIALARENDWDRRADDKARFVVQALSRRAAGAPRWQGVAA
jgi:glycosyltransferase involved in cell wall biosynthesis